MASTDLTFNRNEDSLKILTSELRHKREAVYQGGGERSVERHRKKGKMTARERIDALVDDPAEPLEIGNFAGPLHVRGCRGLPVGRRGGGRGKR